MRDEPRDEPDSRSDGASSQDSADRRYPRRRKLTGSALFDRAFKLGRRRTGKYFALHWVDAVDQVGRLGLIVPKRLTKTGVRRNEVKRLVRESFRHSSAMARPVHTVVRLLAMYPPGERMAARLELKTLLGRL